MTRMEKKARELGRKAREAELVFYRYRPDRLGNHAPHAKTAWRAMGRMNRCRAEMVRLVGIDRALSLA